MTGLPIYEIRLRGRLPAYRAGWFEGLTLTYDDAGNTLLTGPVVDQSALHGLLERIRDLGIPLLAVNWVAGPLPGDLSPT